MKLTRIHFFALAALAALLLGFFLIPRHHVITLTDGGFSPRTLSIHPGDTVTFVSERGEPFWPASDYHPTHALFPAFDPKKAIDGDASWSFTFTAPGTYPFHDHLNPKFQGVIIAGSPQEARTACLAAKAGSFLTPECWALEIQDAIAAKGLPAAFSLIDNWYANDARFRENCHDVMHIVGAEAYKEFKTDRSVIDLPQTAYCGYGFYHGFIEAMVSENGPSEYADTRAYCDAVERTDGQKGSGPCFHGIGHATFDSLDGSLWGDRSAMAAAALSACEKALVTDFSKAQCADGVFNSLANAMSALSYNISFEAYDPISFCSAQVPLYQQGCYGETGIGYIREKHMTRKESLAFLETIPLQFRQYMYFIYFSDEAKRVMADFPTEALRDSCVLLPYDAAQKGCVQGVVEGIREESEANRSYQKSLPFCAAFAKGALRTFCYTDVTDHAGDAEKNQPDFQALCAKANSAAVQCK